MSSGTLGRTGLVGSLGRKTTGNMVIYGTEFVAMGQGAGTFFSKLTGGNNQSVTDNRFSDVMPYAGKFTEFRMRQDGAYRGDIFLQKNGVDTLLGFDNPVTNNTIQKIVAEVPFVAGDVFRFRMTVITFISFRDVNTVLFGGLNVTN